VIAPHDPERAARAFARERGAPDERATRETGRQEVQHVVQPRGHLAEVLEPSLAVPEHRVGGVHRAVDRGAGKAEDHEEARGGQKRVGEVLGEGLDGGGRHLPRIECHGRPADEITSHGRPRSLEITAIERHGDAQARGDESPE
jgi:hypothetical protein